MNQNNDAGRNRSGRLSGIIGIACNAALCAGKIAVGSMAGSMSIIADGLNNLTDSASSVVTLLGFKFAGKPADRKHPRGHARYEYLAALVVSMLILVIGIELAVSSVKKVISPSAVEFSPAVAAVLIFSIGLKLFLMIYNRRQGQRIQSGALLATAADCRNDVIATSAVLAASAAEHFTGWKIDGFAGLLVSVFILLSGISLARETISPLLGEEADPSLRRQITGFVRDCPMVIGCHDLMVHDYGPGRQYASIHVEMDKDTDALLGHEVIDGLERECLRRFGVHLVAHYDPVPVNDPETERLKNLVSAILKMRDERLEIHDFRLLSEDGDVRLVFDMTVPESLLAQREEIRAALARTLAQLEGRPCALEITFDL